jgi:hypothetical protein
MSLLTSFLYFNILDILDILSILDVLGIPLLFTPFLA